RALAAGPEILLLDEPTSALDVSVQAKVIDLLLTLKAQMQLSYIFITHDISLVRTIADRVVVLYQGMVQESGPTAAVFAAPRHPHAMPRCWTSLPPLFSAAALASPALKDRLEDRTQTLARLSGRVPDGTVQVRCYLQETGDQPTASKDSGNLFEED